MDPGHSAAAHDTHSPVSPPNAQSGPPNFPWTLSPELLEKELAKRKTMYTDEEKADAWQKTGDVVRRYSDEMIERWNKEIDTYLTFAGLFSAVLTAFNVESYLLLQPATPDATLLALQQISLQLSSFSTGPPPAFINSTHPALQQGTAPAPPIPRTAIWLNILWFSSLILSLSSASIGMMVKQWLNEYASGISSEPGGSRQTARLRQFRLNSVIRWRVGDIVNTIPVLLQVSVALFLAGLLVLLWTLHPTVAGVASVFAGSLGTFTTFTVLLPSIKPGCAYLSPPSLALYHIVRRTPSLVKRALMRLLRPLAFYLLHRPWIMNGPLQQLAYALWDWEPVKAPIWRGFEQSMVSDQRQSLDADIVSTAYGTAMNPDLLATAAICLSELDPGVHVVDCIERLQKTDENHFGVSPSPYAFAVVSASGPVIYDLWADALLCCATSEVQKTTLSRRARHPIAYLEKRLYFHFLPTNQLQTSELKHSKAMERILIALSIVAYRGDSESLLTDFSLLHKMYRSIRMILAACNRSGFSLQNVCYAAAAAYQRISTHPRPDIRQHLDQFCMYIAAANVVLKCIQACPQRVGQKAILSYADLGLLGLTGALQSVNEDTLVKSDQYWFFQTVWQLSELLNIAIEDSEPGFPLIHTLFPQDRVSALVSAIGAVHTAIQRCRRSEEQYMIWNLAGAKVTLESKLGRLRDIRASYSSALDQKYSQSQFPLFTSTSSIPAEPPSTFVPVEQPTPVLIARPASITVEPLAPVHGVERSMVPRPSSHYNVTNESHASARTSVYRSVSEGDHATSL